MLLNSKVGRVAIAAAIGLVFSAGCATQQPNDTTALNQPYPGLEVTTDIIRSGPPTGPVQWLGAADQPNQEYWSVEAIE
jgi:hypothetical protein